MRVTPFYDPFADAVRSLEQNSFFDILSFSMNINPGRPRRASAVLNDQFIATKTNMLLTHQISMLNFLTACSWRMAAIFDFGFI